MKEIVTGDYVGAWVCERTGGIYTPGDSRAFGLRRGDQLVAGVVFDNYNGRSIAMHVAGEGKWFDREYARVCFDYAFRQLRVKKILGFVSEGNTRARKFDEHIGFREEARIADAGIDGDLLVYTMTKDECRWLNG